MTLHKKFVLIGHPVGHSISPLIHQAAYRELGLSHSYEAVDCPDQAAVERQLGRIRSGEIAGANVTVPHKRLAFDLVDRVDPSAEQVGAANVLSKDERGQLVAYNTDAQALAAELGSTTADKAAVVLGNGGAALAAVVAARLAGAGEVVVSARRFVSGEPSEAWPMQRELRKLGARLAPWGGSALNEAFAHAAFLVQATSAGMKGADPGVELSKIVPWSSLSKQTVAIDLVYNPALTPFLKSAAQAGLLAKNGLGMLVGQAALAFSLWLGLPAPSAAMRSAAERALLDAGEP